MIRINFILNENGTDFRSFGVTNELGDWTQTYNACVQDARRRAGKNPYDRYIDVTSVQEQSTLRDDVLKIGSSALYIATDPENRLRAYYTAKEVEKLCSGSHTVIHYKGKQKGQTFCFSGSEEDCRQWMMNRFMSA